MSNNPLGLPPGHAPDPFTEPVHQPPAVSSGNRGLMIGCGIASVLVILICCGGGGAMIYEFGEIMSAEIEMELRDQPEIRQHIGQIEDLSMNYGKSAAVEGDETYVYDVRGDKGSGELTVESITNAAGQEEVVDASLRLPSGEVVQLELEP